MELVAAAICWLRSRWKFPTKLDSEQREALETLAETMAWNNGNFAKGKGILGPDEGCLHWHVIRNPTLHDRHGLTNAHPPSHSALIR